MVTLNLGEQNSSFILADHHLRSLVMASATIRYEADRLTELAQVRAGCRLLRTRYVTSGKRADTGGEDLDQGVLLPWLKPKGRFFPLLVLMGSITGNRFYFIGDEKANGGL